MRKSLCQLTVGFCLLLVSSVSAADMRLKTLDEIIHGDAGCKPTCEAKCGCEPTCEAKCGCEPACEAKCGCEPTCEAKCGCEPTCEAECGCEPTCEVECGCEPTCEAECGCEPSCGVDACAPRHFGLGKKLFDIDLSHKVGSCSIASDCDAPGCATCVTGCDSCELSHCCEPCLCCRCGWTVWTEAMFLRRSDADSLTLISDQNTGSELVNADNLEFDHRAVPRIHLMWEHCCCWGIEGGFFGIDSWSTHEDGGGNGISPVLTAPGFSIPSTGPGTVFRLNSSSDLYSGEINIRRRWNECFTVLGGFRYIEFDDDFAASTVAPAVQEMYQIDADNHMYGFQIGADAELINCCGRFHIDSIVRTGILFNNADQSTYAPILSQVTPPAAVDRIGARADHTTFLCEVGLRGVFELTPRLSVYGGYHLLLLDGVALAPDQIPVTDMLGPGTATLDTGGTLYFHGATVGLQASF